MKANGAVRDGSTHSGPRHSMQVSGQLHAPADLTPEKSPVPIE